MTDSDVVFSRSSLSLRNANYFRESRQCSEHAKTAVQLADYAKLHWEKNHPSLRE